MTVAVRPAGGLNYYTLTAESASLTLTAQTATLLKTSILSADAGAMTATAQDAVLAFGRYITAESGALTLAAQDAILTYTAQTANGGGIGPIEGLSYPKPTREELARLKRLMGLETVQQVKAAFKRKPEAMAAALTAFRLSGDAEALLERIQAEDGYQMRLAESKQAADREAALVLQARLEDEAIALLLIFVALEW
jgi:hypothetical protein